MAAHQICVNDREKNPQLLFFSPGLPARDIAAVGSMPPARLDYFLG
jgi:hypothetical protein